MALLALYSMPCLDMAQITDILAAPMLVLPLHRYGVRVTVDCVMWGNVVYLPHNGYRILRIPSQNRWSVVRIMISRAPFFFQGLRPTGGRFNDLQDYNVLSVAYRDV